LIERILIYLYYCEIEERLSANTQRNYDQYLSPFKAWLAKRGLASLRPSELTAHHLCQYRLYLACSYRSPVTKLRLAKEEAQGAVSFLSSQDIEKLLAVPTLPPAKARDRAIIELLLSSGSRIAELIALDRSHFLPPAKCVTE
jgi:site-specific recombinase XerD